MEKERLTVTVVGAGGKMGCRITDNLVKGGRRLLFCEKGEAGISRLEAKGLAVSKPEDAIPQSGVVILAIPDAKLAEVSRSLVPLAVPGTIFLILDPAAAYAGELTLREDCTFAVTHPCHPVLFGEWKTPEERMDVFGGMAAEQDIVTALLCGAEEKFRLAESISMEMFSPVAKCHRITVEQMAILEPAAAEVVCAACALLMKEALDETVRLGVPEEAARSFILGHIQIALAVIFKSSNPLSDAAKIALRYGFEKVLRPDWKQVFEPEAIREVLGRMLHPGEGGGL